MYAMRWRNSSYIDTSRNMAQTKGGKDYNTQIFDMGSIGKKNFKS